MTMIELGDNENIESAIKRFRKKCDRDGISRELKKRVHYEKPSLQRKKKIEALKRKLLKKQRRQQKNNY